MVSDCKYICVDKLEVDIMPVYAGKISSMLFKMMGANSVSLNSVSN